MYDGTPLTRNQQNHIYVSGPDGSFAPNEGATYHITGTQTLVGSSPNEFTYTLNSNTLAANYKVDTLFGTLMVTPNTAKITIISDNEDWIYDGESHREDLYFVKYDTLFLDPVAGSNGKKFSLPTKDTLTITSTFGGIAHVSYNALNNNTFTYTLQHNDLYVGQRDTTYGTLRILPRPVNVHIIGNAEALTYDGTTHTVTGYRVNNISTALYAVSDFQFNATATVDSVASRMQSGTTQMGLTPAHFQNLNSDFAPVTFEVTDGKIIVAPVDTVIVILMGEHSMVDYDAQEHTVHGYEIISISHPTYLPSYFNYTGTHDDTVAARTEVGTTWMGLTPAMFHNTNTNFTHVGFDLQSDGYQKINRVEVTGNHARNEYDGQNHTVKGYTFTSSDSLYTAAKFTFNGDSTATQKTVGVKMMNLNASQFVNNDTNFIAIFEVLADGYQEIVPDTSSLTLHCPEGSNVARKYDGTPLLQAATASSTINDGETFTIKYRCKLEGEENWGEWTDTVPSITDYGDLSVEVVCTNPNYLPKSCSYILTIHKREVHLTSADSTCMYNGGWLTYDSVRVSGDGFANGEGATFSVTGQQLLPGQSPNTFTYTLNPNTKADNYDIHTTLGTLHVTERPESLLYPVTVVSKSDTDITTQPIVYDGEKHTVSDFLTLSFTTEDGHPYTVTGLTASVSGYDAGTYTNTIYGEPTVLDEYGNDVTDQFTVQLKEGHMVIGRHPITITVPAGLDTMMYNGTPLKVDYQNIHLSYIAARDTLTSGYIITEGYTEGSYVCGAGNLWADVEGVASHHDFAITHGDSLNEYEAGSSLSNYLPAFHVSLTITERPLELTSNSAEKVYDGFPLTLTNQDFTVTGDIAVAPTDTVLITHVGVQTCVGETANEITSVTVYHKIDAEDVTSSYTITTIDGLLKVTPETTGLTCPDTLRITLTEGTFDTLVSQTQLGVATHALVDAHHATVANDLDGQNPLTAGTHTVTWTLYDACDSAMTTCEQMVEVEYTPCEGVDYNGHYYGAQRIGYQCYLTENLITETDAAGNPIADYHAYKDNPANFDKFGYLYSWYSAVGVPEGDDTAVPQTAIGDNGQPFVQGICPEGWALLSMPDYNDLMSAVGDATLLKDAGDGYWYPGMGGVLPNSGFNARAGGFYNSVTGRYEGLLTDFFAWTSDFTHGTVIATNANVSYYCDTLSGNAASRTDRRSVRCVRKVYDGQ
jgi:uncharacterized protein (TIGR02145 family)